MTIFRICVISESRTIVTKIIFKLHVKYGTITSRIFVYSLKKNTVKFFLPGTRMYYRFLDKNHNSNRQFFWVHIRSLSKPEVKVKDSLKSNWLNKPVSFYRKHCHQIQIIHRLTSRNKKNKLLYRRPFGIQSLPQFGWTKFSNIWFQSISLTSRLDKN